jgi:putative membrane-bound dehydrogenase-like protein
MRICLFLIVFVPCGFALGDKSPEEIGKVPTDAFILHDKSLKVEVWATSPMLYNPTGMDIDIHGNIWVSEAINYRTFKNKDNKKFSEGDRVSVIIDSDGDGKADKSQVFVQDKDLVAPLGVAVLDNKIYVSSSPSLLVYTDVNRNMIFDEGDKKEKYLTGFGGFDHDHSLHKMEVGPDGRFYINAGNAGPHIVSDKTGQTFRISSHYKGGSPYNKGGNPTMESDDGRIWNAGFIMSIKEDGTDAKIIGHNFRNPYGHSVDSFGDVWMNDNDDTQSCRTTWIMRYGNLGYTGVEGTESWRAGKRPGQSIRTAHWRQEDPGVIPSGHVYGNASPTGMVYWEVGDGMLLSAEAGQNVIWGYKRVKEGAGFKMTGIPFMSSTGVQNENYVWNEESTETGKWFRPSDIIAGPDGSLYIADWFDGVVGGHQQRDRKAGGTIYRVSPKGAEFKKIKYDFSTLSGSLEALKSPAVHVRYIARKNILKSGNKAVEPLKDLYSEGTKFVKARVLYLLAELKERDFVRKALSEKDSDIKVAAYRALEQNTHDIPALARDALKSDDIALRREVALSLRDLPFSQSKDLILNLIASFDGKDRWFLEAIGQASEGKEAQIGNIIKSAPESWDDRLALILWRLHPEDAVHDFKARATNEGLELAKRKTAIDALAFIKTEDAAGAMLDVYTAVEGDLKAYALWWLNSRKRSYWKKHLSGVDLKKYDDKAVKQKKLLEALFKKPNKKNLDKLLATKSGALTIIELAKAEKLPGKIKDLAKAELLNHKDTAISSLANIYLSTRDMKYDLTSIMSIKGDTDNGKALFYSRAACFTCHKVEEKGGDIGPELTQINTKFDKIGLLDSIVNPSSGILLGFESISVTLKNGSIVSGMLESDKDPLIINNALGQKMEISLKDIAEKNVSGKSIMPEASAIGLSDQDLADLISYLRGVEKSQ